MLHRLPRTLRASRIGETVQKQNSQQRHYRTGAVWTGDMSFASPEADFNATATKDRPHQTAPGHTWSRSMSYASPEADFTDTVRHADASTDSSSTESAVSEGWWSGTLSFASPESDFSAFETEENAVSSLDWSQQLSFSSPESDFVANTEHSPWAVLGGTSDATYAELTEHLASPECAFGAVHAHSFLEPHHLTELEVAKKQKMEAAKSVPLPKTFAEIMADPLDKRAIVVTETQAPFRVVHVNDTWVGLCGYTQEEAKDQTLRLIQGPETDVSSLDTILGELLKGNEASTVVTNYHKSGRKFVNHLRARPLLDAENNVTHFVGVLEEMAVATSTARDKQMAA